MGTREQLEAWIERAVQAARARRWAEAAEAYAGAAALAMDAQMVEPSRRAWEAAGEAWRRDDHPKAASTALRAALALPHDDPVATATNRVRLASVLSECGNGGAALQLCERAVEELGGPEAGPAYDIAVDSLIGTQLAYGRKEALRPWVAALSDPIARGFREGQLRRLDGELAGARRSQHAVATRLQGRPEAEAGVAGALAELAETDLLDGAAMAAVAGFQDAARLHRAAGRRSLAWRCEAGRIRAMVEAGVDVLPKALDEGLAHAREREMVLLEADLRLARGMALASRDAARAEAELTVAIELADEAGARLRAGRARYELALRVCGPGGRREALAAEACVLLEDAVPHLARAQRLRNA